jgi:hypothetical protein
MEDCVSNMCDVARAEYLLKWLTIGEASVAAGEVLQPEDEDLVRRAREFVAWARQGLEAGEYGDHPA